MRRVWLTCPQCCCTAIRRTKSNTWKCEACGTSFDFCKLRKNLHLLVGRELQEDFIQQLLLSTTVDHYPQLGERGYQWRGKHGIINTLHAGNGWHIVVEIVRHADDANELTIQ